MKVAHFLKHFEPGGIEKWLVDLTIENNKSAKPGLDLHYFLQTKEKAFFDDEILSHNGKLHKLFYSKKNIVSYLYQVYKELKKGEYDVVHSHFYFFSGLILMVAFFAGVKVRVAHCHNDKSSTLSSLGLLSRVYLKLLSVMCKVFSNRRIAVSEDSARAFFGNTEYVSIIPCGLLFTKQKDRCSQRKLEEGINIYHIGSFSYQKNHEFLIDIANELKKRNVRYKLKIIGDGSLKSEIINKINKGNLSDNVELLGKRSDVQLLLNEDADLFLFPSHFEGLGLAAIESQYFGVPTFVTNSLPRALEVSNYIKFLDIVNAESVSVWSNKIEEFILVGMPTKSEVDTCKKRIINSDLAIRNNLLKIMKVYDEG